MAALFNPEISSVAGGRRAAVTSAAAQAQQLLQEYGEPLVRKAMAEALKGAAPLLRCFLSYLLPRWKDAPVKMGPLPARTVADVAESLRGYFHKVGSGELSPQDGRVLTDLLATKVSVLFKTEVQGSLERRSNW